MTRHLQVLFGTQFVPKTSGPSWPWFWGQGASKKEARWPGMGPSRSDMSGLSCWPTLLSGINSLNRNRCLGDRIPLVCSEMFWVVPLCSTSIPWGICLLAGYDGFVWGLIDCQLLFAFVGHGFLHQNVGHDHSYRRVMWCVWSLPPTPQPFWEKKTPCKSLMPINYNTLQVMSI